MNNNQYTTVEVTEELLQSSKLSEPLHLAAMLEQTSQSPLHGKAADCLRRMYAEAQPAPVQEPVAIALNTGTKQGVKWLKNVEHGVSLYTTPPAALVQDVDWKDMYEKEKRRSEIWVAKYEKDIGPLEKAGPAAAPVQEPVQRWAVFCGGCRKEWHVPYQHPGKSICAECEAKCATPPAAQPVRTLEELYALSREVSAEQSTQQDIQQLSALVRAQQITIDKLEAQPAPVQEPLGFMNAGHIHEIQQGRLPYGYVYPNSGNGASVAIYTTPPAAQRQCNWPTCQTEEYQQALAEQINQELVTGAAHRQWVGLSHDEFRDFASTFEYGTGGLIRAIEAKLKAINGFHSTEKDT